MKKKIDKLIWENFLNFQKKKFENNSFFENFLKTNSFINYEDNILCIKISNDFIKTVLDKEYKTNLEKDFLKEYDEKIKILFISENLKVNEKKDIQEKNLKLNFFVNHNMTLENYVIGQYNKNVYDVVNSILNKDMKKMNPIFIYGNTGSGKTHILNAIANKYGEKFSDEKIYLMNTEDFIRSAYNVLSSSGKKIEEFKNSFNDVDLLLVDDVQFLNNKEKLNEFFFSIFNYLISQQKIVIMTSDKIPNEIKIDSRMISRFNSGLNLHIPKPDIMTIKEIIKMKIKNEDIAVPFTKGAIDYIANRFNEDIRILEGIINKIFFSLKINPLLNEIINENTVKQILEIDNNSIYSNVANINPNVLIDNVCLAYGINSSLVKSKKRQKQISFVRKICIFILREKLNLSYSEIGNYFSNRDHSTIISSFNFINNLIKTNLELKKFIDNICDKI